jgi:hypothetical protein
MLLMAVWPALVPLSLDVPHYDYAQAQSQSSHSHGCDPEACMLLVCGHETKLEYYCLSGKISFGAKSR